MDHSNIEDTEDSTQYSTTTNSDGSTEDGEIFEDTSSTISDTENIQSIEDEDSIKDSIEDEDEEEDMESSDEDSYEALLSAPESKRTVQVAIPKVVRSQTSNKNPNNIQNGQVKTPTVKTGAVTTPSLRPMQKPSAPIVSSEPQKTQLDEDIDTILQKMPGISINPAPNEENVNITINDLLKQESSESDDDFALRAELTIKLIDELNYKLNLNTAVTIGHIIMKKAKLNLTYDPDLEFAIQHLMNQLINKENY
jgi:hypothetical protein